MLVLLVEDDPDYALVSSETLRFGGHEVATASGVGSARHFVMRSRPDLAVVDVVLPDGSGLDLCRWIRERDPELPVLMLSSLDRTADVLSGFSSGADDYITKPFHPSELIARVQALTRRAQVSSQPERRVLNHARAGLSFDQDTKTALFKGVDLGCTETEYAILHELAAAGQVMSYAQLNSRIWNYPNLQDGALLKGHVSSLRRKLRQAGCEGELVRTVHGVGYALNLDASSMADSA